MVNIHFVFQFFLSIYLDNEMIEAIPVRAVNASTMYKVPFHLFKVNKIVKSDRYPNVGTILQYENKFLHSKTTTPNIKYMNILLNCAIQKISVTFMGINARNMEIINSIRRLILLLNRGIIMNIHHNAQINQRKYPASG